MKFMVATQFDGIRDIITGEYLFISWIFIVLGPSNQNR